ncbi:MAG: hypothetical protein Q7S39_04615 [Ignavibacteria bacterium]|nr:hypothetical protein [Ignavibacteria bacterium]
MSCILTTRDYNLLTTTSPPEVVAFKGEPPLFNSPSSLCEETFFTLLTPISVETSPPEEASLTFALKSSGTFI